MQFGDVGRRHVENEFYVMRVGPETCDLCNRLLERGASLIQTV